MVLLFGLSLILAACGGGDGATDKDTNDNGGEATVASGEEIAKQNCAGCHGQNFEGAMGPDLTKIGSKYSEDEIKNIIVNGSENGAMPPQSQLSEEQVSEVSSWLAAKK